MPKKPLHPCGHVGCKELTRDAYCPAHVKEYKQRYDKEYDKTRGTRTERGYSNRWLRARKHFLKKHPLCEICKKEGQLTPATEVHHIVKHNGDYKLFWNRENWMSICKSCHSKITMRERAA